MNDLKARWVLCGLALLVGIWVGARLYSSHNATLAGRGDLRTGASGSRTVRTPTGEASAPETDDFATGFGAAPEPRKIPERLPAFSLADDNGKLTSIARWQGRSLVLNFWATWCAPCRREIPLLESLHHEWAARNVTVIGIAVDHVDPVLAYAQQLKIPYPLLIGEQDALDVAAQFGVGAPAFPFTVFTDRRGEVVTLYLGELHKPQADLILGQVERLNRGQLPLAEARLTIAQGLQALAADRPT